MKKGISKIWLALVVSLVIVAPALAEIVTAEVEGVVDSVSVGGRFELDGSVNVGLTMTGTFVYDTDAKNIYSPGVNSAYPIISLSMNIGNYTFTHNPSASEPALFNIFTFNPVYWVHSEAPYFSGTIYADGEPKTFEDITWNEPYGGVTILDAFYKTNHSGELPTSFRDLSLAMVKEFHLGFGELWDYPLPPNRGTFRIDGELTSLRVVQVIPEPATAYYVDALNGDDDNDGLSPETAFATIQKGIDSADDGDTVIAAPGTYTGPGNRDIDFFGKPITVRSIDPNDPNIVAATIIDCDGTETDPHRAFYFHSGEDENSVLDGLTITNGYTGTGGGIYCSESSPTIMNNIITGNTTQFDGDGGGGIKCRGGSPTITNNMISQNTCPPGGGGGGIRCYKADSPTITNNNISGNTASQGAGILIQFCSPTISDCTFSGNSTNGIGGGVLADGSMTLTNCVFTGNTARSGAGVYNYHNDTTLLNCSFTGNSAEYKGGGIYNYKSSTTLTNCNFSANSADDKGGGMYNNNSSPRVVNCTFAANSALNGNALAFDSKNQSWPSNLQMTNSILWDGGDEILNNDGSTITITYSDVQGTWPGDGNIDADPLFIDPNGLDGMPGTEDDDLHLLPGSPCIDAGDNTAVPADTTDLDGDGNTTEPLPWDLDGNPRFVDRPDTEDTGNGTPPIVDMGAYETALPDPVELLDILALDIIDLGLHHGIENSLLVKLDTALQKLEDDNQNNDVAAINSLQAFINVVEAQRGKKIPQQDADDLIAAALQIIELLSNG